MIRNLLVLILTFFAVPIVSDTQNIVQIAADNDDFSVLVTAVQLAGLANTLTRPNRRFTVFAPTNEAFGNLPQDLLTRLTTNPEYVDLLQNLLLYHVVQGRVLSSQIHDGVPIHTVFGEQLIPTVEHNTITINDSNVIIPDIVASNGVIHAIDNVLVPSFLTKNIVQVANSAGQFGTLLTAIDAAGLRSTLRGEGPFTVFAPTDAAFAKLGDITELLNDIPTLTSILTYHVLPGTIVTQDELVDDSSVTTFQGEDIHVDLRRGGNRAVLNGDVRVELFDVFANNGVIHAIDTVLIPPSLAPAQPSIVDLVSSTPALATLVAALTEADLVDALSGPGPFTVFAPKNSAFAALGDGLDDVLADKDLLTDILLYHVVDGEIKQNRLRDGFIEMKNGAFVEVDARPAKQQAFLNDNTRVKEFDIVASNGVVHIINNVLIPPSNIVDVAQNAGFTTLITAAVAAGLDDSLRGDGPLTVFAPTNAAFAALGEATLNELLDDPDRLAQILLYHVVSGRVESSDLMAGRVETLSGETFRVRFRRSHQRRGNPDRVFINGNTRVVDFDVNARNGVIHVINRVLIPPDFH